MATNYYTGIEFFSKGDLLFVKKIVGDDPDGVLEIKNPQKNLYKLKDHASLYVEELHPNGLTATHLRFARKWRNKEIKIRIETDSNMRAALEYLTDLGQGHRRVYISGGIQNVITYKDEIFFCDYKSYGWIVQEEEKKQILQNLPPLVNSNVIRSFWFGVNKSNSWFSKRFFKEPSDQDKERYSIYRIDYDEGSLRILTITSDEGYPTVLQYSKTGYFMRGKRLPRTFRPRR